MPSIDHILHVALRLAVLEMILEVLPIVLVACAVIGGLVAHDRRGEVLPSVLKGLVLGPIGVVWVVVSTRHNKVVGVPAQPSARWNNFDEL